MNLEQLVLSKACMQFDVEIISPAVHEILTTCVGEGFAYNWTKSIWFHVKKQKGILRLLILLVGCINK